MKNTATVLGVALVVVLVLVLFSGLGMMGMMGFGGYGMALAPHATAGVGPGILGGYAGHYGMMGGYGGMMGGYAAQGFGFNPLGAILSLVVWALLIGGVALLVVRLARNAGRTAVATSAGPAPLDILKTRYARGEITKEQFDATRKDLE